MRECAAFALTIFAKNCAAHTGRHVTRVSAGSNTAPATHVQLATNVSSFISAAYTLRSSPATPRSAPAPAAPATLVTLRCSFACLSATPTPAQHLVTQRKPGGSAQSFSAWFQPHGVGEALLLVPLLISDCVLEIASATALPQQQPLHQQNEQKYAKHLQSRSWHVINRLPLDAAALCPDTAAAAAASAAGAGGKLL